VDPADHPRLLAWSEAMVLGSGATTVERMTDATRAFDEYLAYQRAVLRDRRARPSDDLVSILAQAEVDGERLEDDALVMRTLLILIGGDETTRHVLSGGVYQLLRHPEQVALLTRDPGRIPTPVAGRLRSG